MPKFLIKAYEEVYYSTEIEGLDEDDAIDKFSEGLGDYHPWQENHNFSVLDVKQLKEKKNA